MNNKRSFNWKKLFQLLVVIPLFLALPGRIFSQSAQEYHFIYIDISKIKDLTKLQTYLDNLYEHFKTQKFVFYLSNRNEPLVATNKKSFDKLQVGISNLNTTIPNLSTDIEQINKVLSNNDFLSYDASQPPGNKLKRKYEKVSMHFFLDPGTFNTLNMKKYLIDCLCAINYANFNQYTIDVNLYFDAAALEAVQGLNPTAFNSNEFKLIKY